MSEFEAAARARRYGDRPARTWLAAVLVATVMVAAVVLGGVAAAVASAQTTDAALISRFGQIFQVIRAAYIEEIPADELFQAAIDGMMSRLDPYSVYFDPTELQSFITTVDGNYVGIGVQVDFVHGYTTIVSVIPGTPAERAGIQPGDRVQAVDGRDVTGKPTEVVAPLMRGQAGTRVRLTLLRGGAYTPVTLEVERALIHVASVETRNLTPEIGYMRINSFQTDTGRDVKIALDRFRSAGAKGLVLDLRGNPGGLLSAGIEVAGYFVGPRPIVHLVERGGARQTRSGDQAAFGLPVALLVNEGSASASELVAGAMQDHGVAVLVGQTTFGKGVVQSVIDMPGGTAFKLTTMRYYTPNGRHPEPGKGIVPDVVLPAAKVRRLAPVPTGTQLRAGDGGLAVIALQERLAAAGFDPGPADGHFGSRTEAALRQFQTARSLPATGVADAATLERLNRDPAAEQPRDAELDRALDIIRQRIAGQ